MWSTDWKHCNIRPKCTVTVHTLKKVWRSWHYTRPRRSATNPPLTTLDIETNRSLCSAYHTLILDWSVWIGLTQHKSSVEPTAICSSCKICCCRTAMTRVRLTTEYRTLEHNSAKNLPDKSTGSERFESQRLIDVWAGMTMPLTEVCIWARGEHFEYSLWHKLVQMLTAINLLLNNTFDSDNG